MRIMSCGMTDVGLKRVHNEDNYLINEEVGLYVVCDGMGGHAGGEIASAIAVHTMDESFSLLSFEKHAPETLETVISQHITSVVQLAGKSIFDEAKRERRYRGMGTTCVLTFVHDGKAYVAHVGDSRGYLLRQAENEKPNFSQLTQDHSLVNERIRAGLLTVEEAKNYRLKNVITRSLGFENEVEVDIQIIPLQKGDIIMMCSDGLSNLVEPVDMARVMVEQSLQSAARSLIQMACDGGGDDNITVVMFRVDEL